MQPDVASPSWLASAQYFFERLHPVFFCNAYVSAQRFLKSILLQPGNGPH
jgi:hypothetical protein